MAHYKYAHYYYYYIYSIIDFFQSSFANVAIQCKTTVFSAGDQTLVVVLIVVLSLIQLYNTNHFSPAKLYVIVY